MAAARVRPAMRALAIWAFVLACVLGHVDAAVRLHEPGEQLPIGADTSGAGTASLPPAPPPQPQPQRYTSRLNFSSSAPHLFASAHGLLQQWANTVFPNGHALAAATIPAYTLLYHGLRADNATQEPDTLSPPSPEWLALDLEMAYGIMGSSRRSWLLTYQTTRAVRVLYVDGESAALMGLGQLDFQMLLLYGNVTGPTHGGGGGGFGLGAEYDRARGICAWLERQGLRGRGWGYEGIVRMNAGFEVIWCDFLSDSLRLLSRLNVTAPLNPVDPVVEAAEAAEQSYYSLPPVPTRSDHAVDPTNPPAPPNWRGGGGGRYGGPGGDGNGGDEQGEEPFLTSQGWGWFESATWHYGSSRGGPGAGETRVQIDNCGILSYYAPRFDGGGRGIGGLNLSRSRAEEEHRRLNLTAEGHWHESAAENRTVALRQLGRRRRFHHLGNASAEDALLMRRSAETALARTLSTSGADDGKDGKDSEGGGAVCSGAPWTLILAEIVQRMAQHLKTVEAILLDGLSQGEGHEPKNSTEARAWLHRLRAQNHMFMVGYLEYPPTAESSSSAWLPGSALFNRTLSLCRYRYTRLFASDQRQQQNHNHEQPPVLPQEEDDLRWAVEETYGTLCGELLAIGFDAERAWAERYSKAAAKAASAAVHKDEDGKGLAAAAAQWYDQLTELIAWLGWESEFIGCDRVCGWHERCFIPMWPLMSSQWGRGRGPGGGGPGGGGPGGSGRHPPFGRDPHGDSTDGGPGSWPRPPDNGSHGGPGGGPGGPGGRPGFGFPRTPAMMGDDTDLWEPKCVEAWYIMGRR
ncbi:hypothetical protein SCUCBS95973_003360 [Sporothrix curviconia]|uniref:Uncharacterized protein n=1 Tax=Sporothrix curviconia TaxID=1260050 RepID=A0ABP0BET6_9PEZI